MEEENTLKPLKKFTVNTEEDTIARFKNLKEMSGISTDGQFFGALVDRYEQPQRVADRTRELQQKLDAANATIAQKDSELADLRQQLATAQGDANKNAERANQLQLENEQRVAELTPGENQRVVSFTPDNIRVLEYVAARESRRRGQPWSISHVVNFFVYARFIKGMLNGDLGSVSDAELRKLGVNLKTKAKEAVEI